MDPNTSDMSLAEMDYKGAFSKGKLFPLPAERDSGCIMLGHWLSATSESTEDSPGVGSRAAKV